MRLSRSLAIGLKISLRQLHERLLHSKPARCVIWNLGSLLFWGGWLLGYIKIWPVSGDVADLSGTKTQRRWKFGCLIWTGWSHRTHSEKINGNFERGVSRTFDFLTRWRCMASTHLRSLPCPSHAIIFPGFTRKQRSTNIGQQPLKN